MADIKIFLRSIGKQLQPSDMMKIKYLLKDSFPEKTFSDLVDPNDLVILLQRKNLLENEPDSNILKRILKDIGRRDIARKLGICLTAESHIIDFNGYTFVCHMKEENLEELMKKMWSITPNDSQFMTIVRGAGKRGTEVITLDDWKNECQSYFDRYYKTSNVITGPCDTDMIMDTLSEVCSGNNGRGFVFKDYNIKNHLDFLKYNITFLKSLFGIAHPNGISYLAYIEQKNVILICYKILNGSCQNENLKIIVTLVKYFLFLYNKEFEATGVTIIGLLVRENGKVHKAIKCDFCDVLSPAYEIFESPTAFKNWFKSLEGFVNLRKCTEGGRLLKNLGGKILCFMAVQLWKKVHGLPNLSKEIPEQFKQTYLLLTPQQMKVHFSDAKHVVIQGSYGSGKSILGLKKLEAISQGLTQDERIIYINFDRNSKLHLLMEKYVTEDAMISASKVKLINSIREIGESPNESIYVCHNSAGENLSAILQKTGRLKSKIRPLKITNFHVIVEEYDGETLTQEEASKITELTGAYFQQSNVIILAQPLMKKRRWNVGRENYDIKTCMFHELLHFKIITLQEVLRCSNEICNITKLSQKFLQNKNSIFATGIDKLKLEQERQSEDDKENIAPFHQYQSDNPDKTVSSKRTLASHKVSSDETISHFNRTLNKTESTMDLDQAFVKVESIKKTKPGNNKIVSTFHFICEPKQGVDIDGGKPKLVEFSDSTVSTNDMEVISLALVLRKFTSESKTTAFLYFTDEEPDILKKAVPLLLKISFHNVLYKRSIETYLQEKDSEANIIFSSNFRSVNGMEFDHVVIFCRYSEYYLKHYLPQVMSRCTHNLQLVLLPKKERIGKFKFLVKIFRFIKKYIRRTHEDTVERMVLDLKKSDFVETILVDECRRCQRMSNVVCYTDETDKKLFKIHTHSDQYSQCKNHLIEIMKDLNLKEQESSTNRFAEAKILDFLKTYSQQEPMQSIISEQGYIGCYNEGNTETNETLDGTLRTYVGEEELSASNIHETKEYLKCLNIFIEAAYEGDIEKVYEMLEDGIDPNGQTEHGWAALHKSAVRNHTEVIERLIEYGASVNLQGDHYDTPLHAAAYNNHTAAIQLLLRKGADINIKDDLGRTAIDVALQYNNIEAKNLLEDHQ